MKSLELEKEWIAQSQLGDLEAYSNLVHEYQDSVRACLIVRLNDPSMADDLAQDAFVIAFQKIKEFELDRHFGPWVRSIALYGLKNYFRKKSPLSVGGQTELDSMVSEKMDSLYPVEEDSCNNQLEALSNCLNELKPDQKELIHKRYQENEPVSSLTKIFNLAHSTITMRLYRLRESLKDCIEKRIDLEVHT